jgi:hypothetical protein
MQLTVNVCRASDAPEACERNARVGRAVLERYGLANITSARQDWWADHETFALLLQDRDTGEPVGGVRLQRWREDSSLPLEHALEGVDGRARAWVASLAEQGVGELCGLWRSPSLRGLGVGARLTSMGIALAPQAGTNTLLALCDASKVAANLGLGFRRDLTLASRGTLEYPRPGLVAQVLRVDGARGDLAASTPAARAVIAHYRDTPVGAETIAVAGRRVILMRDLRVMREHQGARQGTLAS